MRTGKRSYLRSHLEDMAQYLTVNCGKPITPDMLLRPPAAVTPMEPELIQVLNKFNAERQKRIAKMLEAMGEI